MEYGTKFLPAALATSLTLFSVIGIAADESPGLSGNLSHLKAKPQTGKIHNQVDLHALALSVEAHDYEAALRSGDYICESFVEPFTVAGNTAELSTDSNEAADDERQLSAARLKAKRMNWLPLSFERRYGAELHQRKLAADNRIIPRNGVAAELKRQYDKGDALLKQVLSAIEESYPYEFTLYLLDSDAIEGYAAPGGYLYLTTAALKSEQGELVLAHEIAHVLKRHQTRELQARLISSVDSIDELKQLVTWDGLGEERYTNLVSHLEGAYLNFSRRQELQADACVVRLSANKADSATLDRFALYTDEQGKARRSNKESLFSVHPGYVDRFRHMEAVAVTREQGKKKAYDITSSDLGIW